MKEKPKSPPSASEACPKSSYYYSNLEIFDDSNLEYLLPAFITQIQFDSLDIKSNFFTSMLHLKLSNYDQALEIGFNYHDDNPDDFKVYELIGDIYFEKESWDDALFYYIRSILNTFSL